MYASSTLITNLNYFIKEIGDVAFSMCTLDLKSQQISKQEDIGHLQQKIIIHEVDDWMEIEPKKKKLQGSTKAKSSLSFSAGKRWESSEGKHIPFQSAFQRKSTSFFQIMKEKHFYTFISCQIGHHRLQCIYLIIIYLLIS